MPGGFAIIRKHRSLDQESSEHDTGHVDEAIARRLGVSFDCPGGRDMRFRTLVRLCLGACLLHVSLALAEQGTANQRLVVAAQSGDVAALMTALRDGAAVNEPASVPGVPSPRLALWVAVIFRHVDAVRMLLDAGADPTAAINASVCKDPHILELLLNRGADPNHSDAHVGTPLAGTSLAAPPELLTSCLRSAELLIQHGARVNGVGDGHPPLTAAVESGSVPLVKLLLSKGADVNGIDAGGWPPLMEALRLYSYDMYCPKAQSVCGSQRYLPTIALLLEHGADANFRDENARVADQHRYPDMTGYTVLGVAARYGWYEVAEELLQHGADPGIPCTDGKLAVDMARAYGHRKTAALIENFKRDPTSKP